MRSRWKEMQHDNDIKKRERDEACVTEMTSIQAELLGIVETREKHKRCTKRRRNTQSIHTNTHTLKHELECAW